MALLLALPGTVSAATGPAPDRYDLANGCYAMRSVAADRYVAKTADGYAATANSVKEAEPFFLEPPELGRYLFYGPARDFLAAADGAVKTAAEPSPAAEWELRGSGERFEIGSVGEGKPLGVGGDGELVLGGEPGFGFEPADGCSTYPEVDVNAKGSPTASPIPYGEVSGLIDAHTHMTSFEFIGGRLHCGRPWHPYGAPYALVDCPEHAPGGAGAVAENIAQGNPLATHDASGWPRFAGWPSNRTYTHEQIYYRWLERTWRSGLRVFVNLLTDNKVLCEVYPYRKYSCNEMESVRLQLRRSYELQDYIDAQSGGPGEGWFRIVTNPYEARRVINQGKLAVVLGIETSRLFDCGIYNDVPQCDRAMIDRQLEEVHRGGVRDMELVNKFDNALTGVAGDAGTFGLLTNTGNKYETGSYLEMERCTGPAHAHDEPQAATPVTGGDDLVGATIQAFAPPGALPIYPEPPHCNRRGLSDLGDYLIRQMIKRGMIIDPDHMSVRARRQAMSIIEEKDYSGVISSHSWSTADSYPRIYDVGGLITPMSKGDDNGGAASFVHDWQHIRAVRDDRYLFGFGFGSDMNGFASQPGASAAAPQPVGYPFRSFDGEVVLERNRSGERVWDINQDGMAHYGLYPDWIEELRLLAGERLMKDMGRGPEAYLQMWERAEGVRGPGCRSTHARFTAGGLGEVRLGDRPKQVLTRAGQPERRTRAWSWCVRGRENRGASEAAVFTGGGTVGLIATSARSHRALGVSVGQKAGAIGNRARPAGGGLHVGDLGHSKVVYGVRGGEIDFIAVTSGKIAGKPKTLRHYLRLASL